MSTKRRARSEDDSIDDANADGLSAKQQRAITALLAEPTVAKAAASIGVSDRTIYRWLEEPAFRRVLQDARRNTYSQASGLLTYYATMAVQTLAKVMVDPQSPHPSKVSAATNVLKLCRESIELQDLAERIEELERVASDGRRR